MTSPESLDPRSHDLPGDRTAELLRLFPEIRTEGGKLDFDKLKLALGESVDVGKERYGLTWPGKAECFKTIQTPSLGTLLPKRDESVNFDTTENLIIEGDNLEVLKLLQKSYLGQVKMIYIDPPYNTGNDFIYPDNYSESLKTYLEYTGQVDAEGRRFSTNTEADGRFHSKWLNMMYPRLYLARNLLSDDGLLAVSISDAEVHNLRGILDQVFGEQNFVGCIIWNSTKSVTNTALISVSHTHTLIFAKSKAYFTEHRSHFRLPEDGDGFANPDNDPRGPWKADPFQVDGERPNQLYEITNPNTGTVYRPNPGCSWKNEKKVFDRLLAENRIVFGATGQAGPQRKRFLAEAEERGKVTKTLWDDLDTTTNATRHLKSLMGADVFDNPKPVDLVGRLVSLCVHDPSDALILDFFGGSGTTGEAVLAANRADGGNRRCILVQLPEPLDPGSPSQKEAAEFCAGLGRPATVAEITKERLRRVCKHFATELPGSQLPGFRVFALAQSNFTTWDAAVPHDTAAVERQMDMHVDHVREGRSDEDIVYELLLKSGFPLTTPVEKKTLAGKTVYSVADGAMLVCVDRNLTLEVIRAIAAEEPQRVILLDEGFHGNDQLKANAVQTFKTKGVVKFQTV